MDVFPDNPNLENLPNDALKIRKKELEMGLSRKNKELMKVQRKLLAAVNQLLKSSCDFHQDSAAKDRLVALLRSNAW